MGYRGKKRRRRDSNPRDVAAQQFSRLPPSTTRPHLHLRGKDKTLSRILLFLREEFPLEQDQVDRAYRDAAVREVEHRLEEDVPAHEGNPVGPGPEREVEHVHHLALHERGVMAPGGDDAGSRLGEHQPVEQAVDDVAEGAGGDERQADKDAGGNRRTLVVTAPPLQEPGNPNRQDDEQDDPECGQGILADDAAERHPEGHPLVLDEQDLEPVTQHAEVLPDGHVRLHQDLDDLVDDHEDRTEDEEPCSLAGFHDSRGISSFPAWPAFPSPRR